MNRFKRYIMCATAVAAAVIFALGVAGCRKMDGNDRSRTRYCVPLETETEYVYDISAFTYVNQTLNINKLTGEAAIHTGEVKDEGGYTVPDCQILSGNDFPVPHGFSECKEGYEDLPQMLAERYKKDKVKFIQYYAVRYGEDIYGFCNLYSNCAGYLFAGGQIACEYIVAGIYFKCDAGGGGFTETERFEKCNIIAFDTESVIYYKNKKYYACTAGGEDKFICADEAYDGGFTSYSYAEFFFNEERCLIIMHRGYSNYKRDYVKIVVCNYQSEVTGEFKLSA